GSYEPLRLYLERMKIRQLVLEYATERAGDLVAMSPPELGLGVVNPRTEVIETVDDVKRSIERALKFYRPERLFVNPDSGFATSSNRPDNSSEIPQNKMKTITEAVKAFRGRTLGGSALIEPPPLHCTCKPTGLAGASGLRCWAVEWTSPATRRARRF